MVEHGPADIGAGDVESARGQFEGHQPGAAGHLEHRATGRLGKVAVEARRRPRRGTLLDVVADRVRKFLEIVVCDHPGHRRRAR